MILFGSFFILNTINPELTVLRDLSLPAINNSGSEEGGGSGTTATVVRPFTIPVQRPSCYSYTFNIPDSYTVPEAACPVAPSVAEKGFADTFCDSRNPGTTGETNVHHAIDIFGPEGSPVYAFEGGTIFRLGWNDDGGKRIWIQSDAKLRYYYAHLQKFAPGLTEGKKVAAGELIGYIDRTGNAQDKSPHLHFEIYPPGPFNYGVDAINPKPVLDKLCSVNS
jgi:murein DD-endopeptidase MepM/ murein hydrolase activator NlpD